ncbi:MAG: hypothetical protein KFF50_00090 [Desulfatitalea sp.]|nr:hypothetical protein [Desulfatitalea sp.]
MTASKDSPQPDPHAVGAPTPGKSAEIPSEQPPEPTRSRSGSASPAIKPMHHLPRGKNTWNPKIIRQWWFWPASAAALYVLFYVYPLIWDWFAG